MTERGRHSMERDQTHFRVGPSEIRFENGEIIIRFDEISVPRPPAQFLPERIKGTIRFTPSAITGQVFDIDGKGKHRWWPVGPSGRITVERKDGSGEAWSGHGYTDCNWGTEGLEHGFERWDWARGDRPAAKGGGAYIIYDTERRGGDKNCLALAIAPDGAIEQIEPPAKSKLPRAFWGVARYGHHDKGASPQLVKTLEDGPFYTRSVVHTQLQGDQIELVHEGLSGDRFASTLVKLMLPWRMPRRS